MHLNRNIAILPRLSPPQRQALKLNGVVQAFLFFLSALLLDGGQIFARVMIGVVAYWSAVLIILVRRYSRLTSVDLLIFRFGFALAVLLSQLLQPLVGLLDRR